ncbi:MAG: rod shape-determining protein MreC [Bacteroidales bacterium]|nr:rod shape-determining protein MreC [Bacteroidales bacterium]
MRNLLEFIKRYNYVFLFLLLETVAIVMMWRGSYYQASRMVRWGNAVAGNWNKSVYGVGEYFGLKAENARLAAENARLRAHMEESFLSYNDSVFTMHDTVYRQRYSYVEAEVIKSSRNGQSNMLMLNKGRAQGLDQEMAVISPDGMVGVVVNATRNFSAVMPIQHPDSRNSVKLKRTGSTGTLVWEGGDYRYAQLLDIPSTHKLYYGDTVVTSGFAHDFPEGIMVGYVDALAKVKGTGFYKVKIRLAADFGALKHVYVIDNHFKAEQDSLLKMTEEEERQ